MLESTSNITIEEPSVEHYEAFILACKKMQNYINNQTSQNDISKSESKGFIFAKDDFMNISKEDFKKIIIDGYKQKSEKGASKPEYFRFIMDKGNIVGSVNARAMKMDEFDEKNGLASFEEWNYIGAKGVRVTKSTVILPDYRGKGIVGKAQKLFFDELREKGINEITSTVLYNNKSSQKVQEKLVEQYGGRMYQVYGNPNGTGVKYYNRYIISTDTTGKSKDLYKDNQANAMTFSNTNEQDVPSQRGVSLELDPETGEFIAVADTNSNLPKHNVNEDELFLHKENEKQPSEKLNLEKGEKEYTDPKLQKIRELRKRIKHENIDLLASKQHIISSGLEEVGISKEDIGKTGDSTIGQISKKHKEIAKSQIEDAKYAMLKNRLAKEK